MGFKFGEENGLRGLAARDLHGIRRVEGSVPSRMFKGFIFSYWSQLGFEDTILTVKNILRKNIDSKFTRLSNLKDVPF